MTITRRALFASLFVAPFVKLFGRNATGSRVLFVPETTVASEHARSYVMPIAAFENPPANTFNGVTRTDGVMSLLPRVVGTLPISDHLEVFVYESVKTPGSRGCSISELSVQQRKASQMVDCQSRRCRSAQFLTSIGRDS